MIYIDGNQLFTVVLLTLIFSDIANVRLYCYALPCVFYIMCIALYALAQVQMP